MKFEVVRGSSFAIIWGREEEYMLGIGWWKGSARWYSWYHTYYDGNWFGWRLGPFYYCHGPY